MAQDKSGILGVLGRIVHQVALTRPCKQDRGALEGAPMCRTAVRNRIHCNSTKVETENRWSIGYRVLHNVRVEQTFMIEVFAGIAVLCAVSKQLGRSPPSD